MLLVVDWVVHSSAAGCLSCVMLKSCCAAAQGKEYWKRERVICSQMLAASKEQQSSPRAALPAFTPEDVHCMSAAKSFDYRARAPTYVIVPHVICMIVTAHRAEPCSATRIMMVFLSDFAQVLNMVLHKLIKRRADAAELAFLAIDEQLVDIGDDLFDYEVSSASTMCRTYQSPCFCEYSCKSYASHGICVTIMWALRCAGGCFP